MNNNIYDFYICYHPSIVESITIHRQTQRSLKWGRSTYVKSQTKTNEVIKAILLKYISSAKTRVTINVIEVHYTL